MSVINRIKNIVAKIERLDIITNNNAVRQTYHQLFLQLEKYFLLTGEK